MHVRHAGHGAQREVVTVSGAPTAHDVDMAVGRVVNGTVRNADGTDLHGALAHAAPTGHGVGHVTGTAPDGRDTLDILAQGVDKALSVIHTANPAEVS